MVNCAFSFMALLSFFLFISHISHFDVFFYRCCYLLLLCIRCHKKRFFICFELIDTSQMIASYISTRCKFKMKYCRLLSFFIHSIRSYLAGFLSGVAIIFDVNFLFSNKIEKFSLKINGKTRFFLISVIARICN